MKQNVFSPMEIDAIGEIMNISLGSSATAVSNMLDHRVDITTPTVSVVPVDEFTLGNLEPAIGIEIKYVSGLEGSNIMLLKRNDVKTIVEILMGTTIDDSEFELNELTVSAVCEVMNQMMGAASTALSDFLGRPVNISTPQSFTLDDLDQFKKEHFQYTNGMLVVVQFMLSIENVLKSEFVNVMSVDLARELIAGFGMDLGGDAGAQQQPSAAAPAPEPAPAPAETPSGGKLSQEEIERLMSGMASSPAGAEQTPQPAPDPQPAAAPIQSATQAAPAQSAYQQPAPPPTSAPAAQQAAPGAPAEAPYGYGGTPYYAQPAPPGYYPDPRVVNAKPVSLPPLEVADKIGKEQAENLELIMSVPLEVSVEIGRTRRKVEDILTFAKGSLVVLDKLAGDQVDVFVNGLCVARGDVVVIDDNFGVRITEVLAKPDLQNLAPVK